MSPEMQNGLHLCTTFFSFISWNNKRWNRAEDFFPNMQELCFRFLSFLLTTKKRNISVQQQNDNPDARLRPVIIIILANKRNAEKGNKSWNRFSLFCLFLNGEKDNNDGDKRENGIA
jgi:hypothetical protein